MMTTIQRVTPTTAYRRTTKATERYMEERLWQRALRRLEGPAAELPRQAASKPRKRSFRAVLSALRDGLGRHVDMYV